MQGLNGLDPVCSYSEEQPDPTQPSAAIESQKVAAAAALTGDGAAPGNAQAAITEVRHSAEIFTAFLSIPIMVNSAQFPRKRPMKPSQCLFAASAGQHQAQKCSSPNGERKRVSACCRCRRSHARRGKEGQVNEAVVFIAFLIVNATMRPAFAI